jgi:hypothetical protein
VCALLDDPLGEFVDAQTKAAIDGALVERSGDAPRVEQLDLAISRLQWLADRLGAPGTALAAVADEALGPPSEAVLPGRVIPLAG